MPPTRSSSFTRRLSAAEKEFLIEKAMNLQRATGLLADRISAFDEATRDAVGEQAQEEFYTKPDVYPCQMPVDEAEFHKFWPVFDDMMAGVDEIDTLFDAYVHQFFCFGAVQFISDVYLAKYPTKVVAEIWTTARKHTTEKRALLKLRKSGLRAPAVRHDILRKQNTEDGTSPSWTPIVSDEMGGDESLIGSEVQRRSKSGKILKYTVIRLDRDSHRRRVSIATNSDLDEVVFPEEEMRQLVHQIHSRPQPISNSAMVH